MRKCDFCNMVVKMFNDFSSHTVLIFTNIWTHKKILTFAASSFQFPVVSLHGVMSKSVPVYHVVSFRIVSPIFLHFWDWGFLVITHLPSQVSHYATRTSVLQATSPLCCKLLRWLVLTMIASEMSPLKQRAWQDCRAFSLWGVPTSYAVLYASLIANHPTDTRHVF